MVLGECELSRVKKGEIIQILRKGFFRCDVPYSPISKFSSREQPLVLFHIPDGHSTSTTNNAAEEKVKTKKEVYFLKFDFLIKNLIKFKKNN